MEDVGTSWGTSLLYSTQIFRSQTTLGFSYLRPLSTWLSFLTTTELRLSVANKGAAGTLKLSLYLSLNGALVCLCGNSDLVETSGYRRSTQMSWALSYQDSKDKRISLYLVHGLRCVIPVLKCSGVPHTKTPSTLWPASSTAGDLQLVSGF